MKNGRRSVACALPSRRGNTTTHLLPIGRITSLQVASRATVPIIRRPRNFWSAVENQRAFLDDTAADLEIHKVKHVSQAKCVTKLCSTSLRIGIM